ncbi:hypothetical protein EON83_27740 [bacterium]|nr:MAG: hypothetical protein EON83_27740 [bacterium]
MKPLTHTNTLRRLEAIEVEARAQQEAKRRLSALDEKGGSFVPIMLATSLTNEEAAAEISAMGGRGDVRTVARVRELVELARWRQMQGIIFA